MNENKKLIFGVGAGVAFSMAVSHLLGVVEANNFVTALLWGLIGYNNINQVKNK